jgi:hypothetical protein
MSRTRMNLQRIQPPFADPRPKCKANKSAAGHREARLLSYQNPSCFDSPPLFMVSVTPSVTALERLPKSLEPCAGFSR